MTKKKLLAAGLIITMMLPVGNTAFANNNSACSSTETEICESFKLDSTTGSSISCESFKSDSTTGSSISMDKKPGVSKKPEKNKPLFSAKAKSELEKPVQYETGEVVQLPDGSNFYREGYRFIGWNTEPDAETGFFEIVMEEDTVLYAVWVKEKPSSTTESSVKFEKNESIKKPELQQSSTTESNIEYNKHESDVNTDITDDIVNTDNTETENNEPAEPQTPLDRMETSEPAIMKENELSDVVLNDVTALE